MHPDLALRLMRARRDELDRAARLWVRHHPPTPDRTTAARPVGGRLLSLRSVRRVIAHRGVDRPCIAPVRPG